MNNWNHTPGMSRLLHLYPVFAFRIDGTIDGTIESAARMIACFVSKPAHVVVMSFTGKKGCIVGVGSAEVTSEFIHLTIPTAVMWWCCSNY